MSGGGDRISDVLGADHRDLDERWDRFRQLPASRTLERRELFDSFRSDLVRHIAIEEESLFPLLESSDSAPRGLAERLLDEHRQIQEILGRLAAALVGEGSSTDELAVELVNVLREHNAREEAFAYPWLDDHANETHLKSTRTRLGLPP